MTYSLGLEGLNRLNLSGNIVCHRLELFQGLLSLIDNGLVLENRAVVVKIDGGGGIAINMRQTLGLAVTLAESLEGGDGL